MKTFPNEMRCERVSIIAIVFIAIKLLILIFVGPIFVIQWIYDLAQIREDNPELARNPLMLFDKEYRRYMHCLGERVRLSLKSVRYKNFLFVFLNFESKAVFYLLPNE